MRRKLPGLFALLLLGSGTARAGDDPVPALFGILRGGALAPGWSLAGKLEAFRGEGIYDYMDGAGEIPRACGFVALAAAPFRHQGGLEVTAEVLRMSSDADAFGISSLWRDPAARKVALTHRACLRGGELFSWRGAYAIAIREPRTGRLTADPAIALARALERRIAAAGALPSLLRCLPRRGCVEGSARYFHGKYALDTLWFRSDNVLRLGADTSVALADYSRPKGRAGVVSYPTKRRADEALEGWRRALGAARGANGAWLVDTREQHLGAFAAGSRIGIIFSAPDRASRQSLLDAVRAGVASPGPAWSDG
ncbi:MAG: hypothetical protein HYU66_23380 [Armatimonadetes bacterium]|nr:hypothetical protein [Armatimonadota bacterium]